MKNFSIYVESAALGQTGIHWRNVSKENQPCETPSLLMRPHVPKESGGKASINYMIDNNTPSLIFFRCKSELLVEITGLFSPRRSEKAGGKVFNTLVLQGEDSRENEKIFRLLALSALYNLTGKDYSLEQVVDQAVNFKGKEEFEVKIDTLEEFIESLESRYEIQSLPLADIAKEYYIQNKDIGLEQIINRIQDSCFPNTWKDWYGEKREDGILIAVTKQLRDKGIFYKAGVWCGLADEVIEPEKPKPQVTAQKKSVEKDEEKPIQEEVVPTQQQKETTNTQSMTRPMLILILVIILVITLIIVQQIRKPEKQPQRTPIPQELSSPSEIKEIL